ncbi:MAG TPA: cytochrome c biogenesis protein CcdA, partial [Gemmataceae bacterium]|nr:cytochrome c biogenesis protein CcdA [Gemmataceae bacterium]
MKPCFQLLTLVFVLAFVGPSLQLARGAADIPVVRVSATLTRTSERTGQLSVTADIKKGFHIYAQSQTRPFLATKISAAESSAVRVTGAFTPSRPPKIVWHPTINVELHEYEGQVMWTAPVEFWSPPDADLVMRGMVFAQACEDGRCLAPETYAFKAALAPQPTRQPAPAIAQSTEVSMEGSKPTDRFSLDDIVVPADSSNYSIWAILPLAFVAGFLLNLMPCVLPVVGLKLLSFVQQANDSRRRVLLLNVAYSAGLLSVMLVLASLAVFTGLAWGEQFSSTTFSVTLTCIVFAFALSFLGVWEISVPAFVGASAAASSKGEGYGGAFSKGVLSTLLATPCSGPFLGSALAWATAQPALLTFAVFAAVGLGMASPYLLVGLFPSLVRLLPRSGNWMVTFKQLMGFVLLATVVYLMSFLSVPSVVPTVLLLLGVGLGCWWIGRASSLESLGQRLRAWGIAAAVVASMALLSFGWLENVMAERFERAAERLLSSHGDPSGQVATSPDDDHAVFDWEPFSQKRLEDLVNDGKTVFVDFTADWCLTCKANEAAAIERPEVARLLRA